MKNILFVLFLSLPVLSFSQKQNGITVSVAKQRIIASLDEDNSDKTLVIHANIKSIEKLGIINRKWQEEKEWKRTFEIVDASDNPVMKVPASNQSSYHTSIKQLRSKLKKGQAYSLYTMAIPKDPNVAATVRVRRILVCTIKVK